MIVDDRGVARPATTFAAGECPDPDDDRVRAMFARIRRDVADRKIRKRIPWRSIGVPVAAIVVVSALDVLAKRSGLILPGIAVVVPVLIVATVMTQVLVRGSVRRDMRQLVDPILSIGRCPCCGYALGSLPRDDQMVTCSECGAVWRSERVAKTDVANAAPAREMVFRTQLTKCLQRTKAARDDAGNRYVLMPSELSMVDVHLSLAQVLWDALRQLAIIIGCVAAMVAITFLLIEAALHWGLDALLAIGIFVVTIPLLIWSARRGLSRGLANPRDRLLAMGHCPACGNLLPAVTGEQSSCAGCGATWNRG